MIYFRVYIENYDGATRDLSMVEDGAYWRLLRHYYSTELPIPLDSDKVARICKAITLEERAAIEAVLDRFFIRQDDGWHNKRADEEIDVSRTARANGSRGGRPAKTETETGTVTGSETEQVTQTVTQSGTGSGHPSNHLTTYPPNHLALQPSSQVPSASAAPRGRAKPTETGPTWEAYSQAYLARWNVVPVRNARVNGQLASLVRCIGAAESPDVAAFFVRHNRAHYVQAKHSTSLLARDAEGLRTEWATGRQVSETEARQGDRTMATGNAFGALIEEAQSHG